jgi:hypothetical protein
VGRDPSRHQGSSELRGSALSRCRVVALSGSDKEKTGRPPIRVRYMWSRVTTGSPRWEQAFSTDGVVTWETNWINDFTRAADPS